MMFSNQIDFELCALRLIDYISVTPFTSPAVAMVATAAVLTAFFIRECSDWLRLNSVEIHKNNTGFMLITSESH